MPENPDAERETAETEFGRKVGSQADRKLKSRRNPTSGVWLGLGTMGLIGWSVVIPTLLGAGAGHWLDRHYPGSHSWTLVLLMAGLTMGCFNAWQWVAKEERAIREEQEDAPNAP